MSAVSDLDSIIFWLDLIGVAVFAVSGALTASRKQLDVVSFALVAIVTGIGGGTIRDLLLGRAPVFWIAEPFYLAIGCVMALIVFFTAHAVESRYRVLLWADAAGLGLFCVIGAETALASGAPPGVAVLMGVITATFGGLIRDVLCAEVSLILRREIYITAAALGAATYCLLDALGVGRDLTVILAFLAGFGLRAVALVFGLSLPGYRGRPGRDYGDGRPD